MRNFCDEPTKLIPAPFSDYVPNFLLVPSDEEIAEQIREERLETLLVLAVDLAAMAARVSEVIANVTEMVRDRDVQDD
ncbi:MAG: hypothetical protein KDK08_05250 [Rhizobiaceae bacterium]|nr:hypothetical protein [Rhizobiaceae bacterium]MCC0000876.1 hypothetical protein [Methylobacteriaceae bacterium]